MVRNPKLRLRRWLRIGCKLLAGIFILAIVYLWWPRDEPPPDVSDLAIEPLKLADDQNAYALAAKAAGLIRPDFGQIDYEELEKQADGQPHTDAFREMRAGKNWDPALARKWLEGTDAIWPLLERAANTPQGQAPWIKSVKEPLPRSKIYLLGKLTQIQAWNLAYNGKPDEAIAVALVSLLFQQNLTRHQYADWLRAAIAAADHDQAAIKIFQTNFANATPLALNNIVGRDLLWQSTGVLASYLESRQKEQSLISVTEVFIALLLYDRDHHELPSTLNALVPDYLPVVPRDYFDSQPIRYSHDGRTVWSVGSRHFELTNEYDRHSEDPSYISDQEDGLYLKLDFAAPPAARATGAKP